MFSKNMSECVICLEEITVDTLQTTKCKHDFHEQCLQNWFNNDKNTCPMCRTELRPAVFSSSTDFRSNHISVLNDLFGNNFNLNLVAQQTLLNQSVGRIRSGTNPPIIDIDFDSNRNRHNISNEHYLTRHNESMFDVLRHETSSIISDTDILQTLQRNDYNLNQTRQDLQQQQHIELVHCQVSYITRDRIRQVLQANNWDIVGAIMELA